MASNGITLHHYCAGCNTAPHLSRYCAKNPPQKTAGLWSGVMFEVWISICAFFDIKSLQVLNSSSGYVHPTIRKISSLKESILSLITRVVYCLYSERCDQLTVRETREKVQMIVLVRMTDFPLKAIDVRLHNINDTSVCTSSCCYGSKKKKWEKLSRSNSSRLLTCGTTQNECCFSNISFEILAAVVCYGEKRLVNEGLLPFQYDNMLPLKFLFLFFLQNHNWNTIISYVWVWGDPRFVIMCLFSIRNG